MIATFFWELGICRSFAQLRLRRTILFVRSGSGSNRMTLAPVRGSMSVLSLAATGTVIIIPSNSGMAIPMEMSMGLQPCNDSFHSARVL